MAVEVGVGSLPLAMSDCDKDPSRFQSGLIVFLQGRLVKNSMLWQISELLLFPSPVRSPRDYSLCPLWEHGRAPQGKTNKMFKFPWIFKLSDLYTLSLCQFISYISGFPAQVLVLRGFLLWKVVIYLPVYISHFGGSSLPSEFTSLADLRIVFVCSAFYLWEQSDNF